MANKTRVTKTKQQNIKWYALGLLILILGGAFLLNSRYERQKAGEEQAKVAVQKAEQEEQARQARVGFLRFKSDIREALNVKLLKQVKQSHAKVYKEKEMADVLESFLKYDEEVAEAIEVISQSNFIAYQKDYQTKITRWINEIRLSLYENEFKEACLPKFTDDCDNSLIEKITSDLVIDVKITVDKKYSPLEVDEALQAFQVYKRADEILIYMQDKRSDEFKKVFNFDEISDFIYRLEFYYYVNTASGDVPPKEQKLIDEINNISSSQGKGIENFLEQKTGKEWSSEYQKSCTDQIKCNNWKEKIYDLFTEGVPSPQQINTRTLQPFINRFQAQATEGQRLMDE